MQRAIIIAVLLVGLTLSGGMLILAWTQLSGAPTPAPVETVAEARAARREFFRGIVLPDFNLVDQAGRTITRSDLADGEHYTVLDFMFSNCRAACPMMSSNMFMVYNQTAGLPVRFVSITVDPTNDTPERLSEYASRFKGVTEDRWRFVTGDEKVINRIVEALGFSLTIDSASAPIPVAGADDGATMSNIIHPTRFVLFAPDGTIIDSYNAFERVRDGETGDMDRLLREIDELVRE